jgi:hypothetical protein
VRWGTQASFSLWLVVIAVHVAIPSGLARSQSQSKRLWASPGNRPLVASAFIAIMSSVSAASRTDDNSGTCPVFLSPGINSQLPMVGLISAPAGRAGLALPKNALFPVRLAVIELVDVTVPLFVGH